MCLSGCSVVVVVHKLSLSFMGNNDSDISPPFPLSQSSRFLKGESSKGSSEFVVLVLEPSGA